MNETTESPTKDLWCVSVETASRCLQISTRRVRQYIESGMAVRHGPNRVDLAWLIHADVGRSRWGRRPGRPDVLTLVALGWLIAHQGRPEPEDVPLLVSIAERNHYTARQAEVALGVARALFPVREPAHDQDDE